MQRIIYVMEQVKDGAIIIAIHDATANYQAGINAIIYVLLTIWSPLGIKFGYAFQPDAKANATLSVT